MEKDTSKKPVLRLQGTVTRRTVPMTARGCDMIRAIRDKMQNDLKEQNKIDYDIPFPTVIHLVLKDYCEYHNIEVEDVTSKLGSEDGESKESSIPE